MCLISSQCFADVFDHIRDTNSLRAEKYNSTLNSTLDPTDPLELSKISLETSKIDRLLTQNIDKEVHATEAQQKKALQAVFATEIIYGDMRPSYLGGIKEMDDLYGHFYVLEYSTLFARDCIKQLAFSDTIHLESALYQRLCRYSALSEDKLFSWFIEIYEKHAPGRQIRLERIQALEAHGCVISKASCTQSVQPYLDSSAKAFSIDDSTHSHSGRFYHTDTLKTKLSATSVIAQYDRDHVESCSSNHAVSNGRLDNSQELMTHMPVDLSTPKDIDLELIKAVVERKGLKKVEVLLSPLASVQPTQEGMNAALRSARGDLEMTQYLIGRTEGLVPSAFEKKSILENLSYYASRIDLTPYPILLEHLRAHTEAKQKAQEEQEAHIRRITSRADETLADWRDAQNKRLIPLTGETYQLVTNALFGSGVKIEQTDSSK